MARRARYRRCGLWDCSAPAIDGGTLCRPHTMRRALDRRPRFGVGVITLSAPAGSANCPAHPLEPLWGCRGCEDIAEGQRQEGGDLDV